MDEAEKFAQRLIAAAKKERGKLTAEEEQQLREFARNCLELWGDAEKE